MRLAGRLARAAQQLRCRLDSQVVGHAEAKEALLLAVAAREHVLLDGPAGSAKSLLAETLVRSVGLRPCIVHLHRDMSAADLFSGGAVVVRERTPEGGTAIRHSPVPGRLASADVAVLDDVSCVPSEVIATTIAAAGRRRGGPLHTTVATCCLEDSKEGLDASTLDRFTLQARVRGLVMERRWHETARIVGRNARAGRSRRTAAASNDEKEKGSGKELARAADAVEVPPRIRRLLLRLVQSLAAELGDTKPVSDRAFLVKAVRVLRARAALAGRAHCVPTDLFAMRFLTLFRVPAAVHQRLEDIIRGLIAADEERGVAGEALHDAQHRQYHVMADAAEVRRSHLGPRNAGAKGKMATSVLLSSERSKVGALERHSVATGRVSVLDRSPGLHEVRSVGGSVEEDVLLANMSQIEGEEFITEGIDTLVSRLAGNIDKGSAELVQHSGGAPRQWCSWDPREADRIVELDAVDVHQWISEPSPLVLPRMQLRMRKERGGLMVVLRDVSLSMTGACAKWSARVTLELLEVARRRGMRFGYIEFNHASLKYCHSDGEFFSTDYASMSGAAMNLKCSGWTNYEQPLSDALFEFECSRPVNGKQIGQRHIVLVTDGIPTHGDPEISGQRSRAKDCGVAVHSIYIGSPLKYPSALEALSGTTGGLQFTAVRDGSVFHVVER